MLNKNNYFDSELLSQSRLKTLLFNPSSFVSAEERDCQLFFEEKQHFILGDAVDILLTEGQQTFDRTFYTSTLDKKPSDTLKSITHHVVELVDDRILSPETFDLLILQSFSYHRAYENLLDNTKITKFMTECSAYYNEVLSNRGKTLLTTEDKTTIDNIVMSLTTHDFTAQLFRSEPNVDILGQFAIEFNFYDRGCKALLDRVIVDHKKKTIRPVDIKTIGDYTTNFPKSIVKWRYDIQDLWYTEAIKFKQRFELWYPDYEVLPFLFVVESTKKQGTPLVYSITNLQKATDDVRELFSDLSYYEEHGFDYPREVAENRGFMKINLEN